MGLPKTCGSSNPLVIILSVHVLSQIPTLPHLAGERALSLLVLRALHHAHGLCANSNDKASVHGTRRDHVRDSDYIAEVL